MRAALLPLILALSAASGLAAPPSAEELNRVIDYWKNGAGDGPVVLELIACKKLGKDPAGKTVCEEKIGDVLAKGEELTAYVRLFVPKGAKYEDLQVKFLLDGEVRSTTDYAITENFVGYVIYATKKASKAGTWEVQVSRAGAQLGSIKVKVQ